MSPLRRNCNFRSHSLSLSLHCALTDNEVQFSARPRVAVIREEGINGDREMIASLYMAGFDVADVMITDILGGRGNQR